MDAFVAEVRALPYGFVPSGWAPCKGQILPVDGNTALYSLLGNRYGGVAGSTFALPTLEPLAAKSGTLQYCIALQGTYPSRP